MYKQKHILVIDDDKKLGNLLKSFLTEKGYLVDFVENTLIAKEKLFNIIFDLLILDVMLPKESHGYRSKESILHVLWEQDKWLEKYLKSN